MRARRATALLVTTLAVAASSPEASIAGERAPATPNVCKKANNNAPNRLLRKVARQIGGKIVNFKPEWIKGDNYGVGTSLSVNGDGGSKTVTIDSGQSAVAGSSGEYTMTASAAHVGSNGRLDASDINRVRVTAGSAADGGPLFGLTINHLEKRWTDGPRDNNCWYGVNGTAVMPSGQRVSFNGTPNPLYANQLEIFLDGEETAATGTVMNGVVNNALNVQPTQLVQPPVKELQ